MDKIFSVKYYPARDEKRVLFFFPAGFTQMWHYRLTVMQLNRMGVSVVGFNIRWRRAIRQYHNLDHFIDVIKEVDRTVGDIITRGKPGMEYAALGISFGSVLSLYTAKRHKQIKSIILFVPYGTLSHLLWTYRPTKVFLRRLVKNGLKSEAELAELTRPIETQYQLDKLKGRRIVSFNGKSDRVVFDGQKLVDAIKKEGIDATFYESRFGHFGTSVVGLLQKSKWDKVLR